MTSQKASSLSNFLGPTGIFAQMRKRKQPQHKMIKVIHRPARAARPGDPSIVGLVNDVLLMVFELVHASHAPSMSELRLVCSHFDYLSRYVSHGDLTLDLSTSRSDESTARLKRIQEDGLLCAIRRLHVTNVADDSIANGPRKIDRMASESLCFLRELLPCMKGLRAIEWSDGNNMSRRSVQMIETRTDSRLSVRINFGATVEHVKNLRGCAILTSLSIRYVYHDAEECTRLMVPLKEVLLSAKDLRCLKLDIGMPKSGCVIYEPPNTYCGLGFVDGEAMPPLEQLTIEDYPFDGLPMRHGVVSELDRWANAFDWSRLEHLDLKDTSLALRIMHSLTGLRHIKLDSLCRRQDIQTFFVDVPVGPESITTSGLQYIDMQSLLRHRHTLTALELHQTEDPSHPEEWNDNAIDVASLTRIRQECVEVEELRLDVARDGDWPWDLLQVIASFPRLRRLSIWFALGTDTDPTEPKVTFDAVKMLFKYVREHAAAQPGLLQECHIYSGCVRPIGLGYPSREAFWPEENSVHFVCKISARDDEAAQGVFTAECPRLRRKHNARLNAGIVVEHSSVETSAEEFWHDWQARNQDALEKLARCGPQKLDDWLRNSE